MAEKQNIAEFFFPIKREQILDKPSDRRFYVIIKYLFLSFKSSIKTLLMKMII